MADARISITVDGAKVAQDAVAQVAAATKATGDAALGANPKLEAFTRELAKNRDAARAANDVVTKTMRSFSGMGDSATEAAAKIGRIAPPTSSLTGAFGLATAAAGAFGISLGVSTLASFARGVFDDADALVKMSDKTGIGVEGLQRLRIAGDDAGVGLDSMTSAVNQMQNRLAGGDASAVGALKRLHLSLGDIQRMAPDRQFMAIADAMRSIQDPAQQVNVAMDLFGRGGVEVLPVIKRGFDDVKDTAVGMSEAAVKTLDAAGDAMAKLSRKGLALAGEGLAAVVGSMWDFLEITRELERKPPKFIDPKQQEAFEKFQAILEKNAKETAPAATSQFDALGKKLTFVGDAALKLSDGLYAQAPLSKEAAALAKKHKEELEKLAAEFAKNTEAARKNEAGLAGLHATVGILNARELDNVKATMAAYDAFKKLEQQVRDIEKSAWIATFGFQGMTDGLESLGAKSTELDDIRKSTDRYAEGWKQIQADIDAADQATADWLANSRQSLDDLSRHFATLGQIAGGSLDGITRGMGTFIEHVNQISKSSGSLTGDLKKLGDAWKALSTSQQAAVATMAGLDAASGMVGSGSRAGSVLGGAKKGAQIGSIAGPYGTLVGAGVGAIVGALKVTQNEKDARAAFDAFQRQFGSLDHTIAAVGQAYADMGLTGERAQHDLALALDATHHSAGDVSAALATINGILDQQKAHAAAVDDAMSGLLGTIDAVGIGVPDAFKPMIDQLTAMPGLTDIAKAALQGLASGAGPNFKSLEAEAKGFGIELGALGPIFQQQHVTDEASKIIDFLEKMRGAGADMGGVAHGMADEISQVVQESMKFGTTIPLNIEEMVKSLSASGDLLDENGKKIDDISTLRFGDPIKTSVDLIADSIKKLVEAIDKIPGALAAVPGKLPNPMADWGLPTGPRISVGGADWGGAQANGGDYLVKRPTLFLAGEAGPERATFIPHGTARGDDDLVGAVRALASALSGGVTVVSKLNGKELTRELVQLIPGELRRVGAI